jgi:hypothetical protein
MPDDTAEAENFRSRIVPRQIIRTHRDCRGQDNVTMLAAYRNGWRGAPRYGERMNRCGTRPGPGPTISSPLVVMSMP